MEPLLSFGQNAIILIVGLAVRFLVAVVLLAAIVGVMILAFEAWKGAMAWRRRVTGLGLAGSVTWLRRAYYAPWHTWLVPTGEGTARVGVDAFAERLMPHVATLQVVSPGTQLHAGDPVAYLTAGRRTMTLRAPADGMVIGVNHDAQRWPSLLTREPYRQGWLAVVSTVPQAYAGLKHGEAVAEWLEAEDRRLQHGVETALGFAAADGGDLVASTTDLLTDEQWNELVREFV
ncbi:MAG: glycine cleavage system protein H [Vicinamibacterales bacterium]